MYRFALRPRWILGHVVVLVLIAALVSLGFWQLRRLDQRRAEGAALSERASAPPRGDVPIAGDPADLERYRYRLTGVFDPSEEILVRGRLLNGLPGYEVLTPLVVGDGEAVLVNRGWVPLQMGDSWPDAAARPPAGPVTVTGVARRSERSALRPSEGPGGVAVISAIRLDDLEDGTAHELAPVWLIAERGATAGELPAPLPPPDVSDGPHLSYAIQWFLFATIAAVGWVILVRQSAQRARRGRERTPPDGAPEAPPEHVGSSAGGRR